MSVGYLMWTSPWYYRDHVSGIVAAVKHQSSRIFPDARPPLADHDVRDRLRAVGLREQLLNEVEHR